jgi:hypothetical protein
VIEEPSSGATARGYLSPAAGELGAESVSAEVSGKAGSPESGALRTSAGHEHESHDDDRFADARLSWLIGLLLSYSSAVTLALAWVLWTGSAAHAPNDPATGKDHSSVEPASRSAEAPGSVVAPPIPAENLTSLGRPIRLGALEFTPLEIVAAPVQLVRSIDPTDVRDEESNSLVLRFRLTNKSNNLVLTPLDAALARDQISPLDRPYIDSSRGKGINLFPLAVDSEWLIAGQSFPVLDPGESAETLLASEPIKGDRPTGEFTWRLRLRIGPYRSDMVGVRFNGEDIKP